MICGNLIAKQRKNTGANNIFNRFWGFGQSLKIGRVTDIGRLIVPDIGLIGRRGHSAPMCIARKNICVGVVKNLTRDVLAREFFNLSIAWPNIS